MKALLVVLDRMVFDCEPFGAGGKAADWVVFDTSMSGYGEGYMVFLECVI